jgi:hypothetical protein
MKFTRCKPHPIPAAWTGDRLALIDRRHELTAGAIRALAQYPGARVNGHSAGSTVSYRAVRADDLNHLGQLAGRPLLVRAYFAV